MPRREPATESQVFWYVKLATDEAERIGAKYDKAIENLIYYTNIAKRLFPKQWDTLMAEKQRMEDLMKQKNEAYEAKTKQETAMEGNK